MSNNTLEIKHILTNKIDFFIKKYDLIITSEQNDLFDKNQELCHNQIYYLLLHLMFLIDLSREKKINDYSHIKIYKSMGNWTISVMDEFKIDFIKLTKLEQSKIVEHIDCLIKDLCKFIPEYNINSNSKKIKKYIYSLTSVLPNLFKNTIHYVLDNGCEIYYDEE